ncbi:hypothetical protein [Marispirochaeta sp.]|uniref:hypothetical protein n=1 Tax=Marispirochaeta sp. TaxID=2038653 RepID=UPI0029C7BA89|nr:hypothetical protein [Marispirochaeta sp.]
MISNVPGTLKFSGGGAGPVLRPGRLLTVIVHETGPKGLIIEIDGLRLKVSSSIPLKKGDIFVSRVETGPRGIFLKILERSGDYAAGDVHRLSELMRQEPELVRALIRSGLSLHDDNLKRFRRLLGEKKGKDREEFARYLTLLEEKNLIPLIEPETAAFFSEKNEHEQQENSDAWREAVADAPGVRSILLRKSERISETALFNHKKSRRDEHWLKIPLRLKIGKKTFSGELRLRIGLEKHTVKDGTLKLSEETDDGGDSWVFGICDDPEKSLYLIEHPAIGSKKLSGFVQKVRKLGFSGVDTLSREGFDGFSLSDIMIQRSVDAQA